MYLSMGPSRRYPVVNPGATYSCEREAAADGVVCSVQLSVAGWPAAVVKATISDAMTSVRKSAVRVGGIRDSPASHGTSY